MSLHSCVYCTIHVNSHRKINRILLLVIDRTRSAKSEPNLREKLGPFTEHVRPFWPNIVRSMRATERGAWYLDPPVWTYPWLCHLYSSSPLLKIYLVLLSYIWWSSIERGGLSIPWSCLSLCPAATGAMAAAPMHFVTVQLLLHQHCATFCWLRNCLCLSIP